MVGRYSGEEEVDETCPNCGCRENAAHLCVCTNEERSRLFEENVEELRAWMSSHGNTDPQLVHWVSKYILERGEVKFENLGSMSPELKKLAESQDKIGWRNLMEGRISKHFIEIQQRHLEYTDSFINGNDWVKSSFQKCYRSPTHNRFTETFLYMINEGGTSATRD